MKKPIKHSANLMLDEDFIRRAMNLKGGRDLNAADFRVLLEAGLQAMEAFASEGQEGCDDPDCVGCRIGRGEQPRPAIMAEFNAVRERLAQSAEESAAGKVKDWPVTIEVSEASLIFMAWLDRVTSQRVSGGVRLAGADIDLNRQVDQESAGRFLAHLVVVTLERVFQEFEEGRHPLLFAPAQRRAPDGSTIH